MFVSNTKLMEICMQNSFTNTYVCSSVDKTHSYVHNWYHECVCAYGKVKCLTLTFE